MKHRKRIGLTLALVALLTSTILTLEACHKNVTYETPKAASAAKADDIVIRINELQAAVIQACGPEAECTPNTIPTATARQIVRGLIDIRTTLRSAPEGWQATVKAAWVQLKPRFVGITNPVVVAALAAVDTLLGGLQ